MTVKEFILGCPEAELANEYFKLLEVKNRISFDAAFNRLLAEIISIEPITTDEIVLGEIIDDGSIDVTLHIAGESENYSLIFVEWNKLLGCSIDEENAIQCGRERLAAAVLHEITFFGCTAEKNQKYAEETIDAVEETKRLCSES